MRADSMDYAEFELLWRTTGRRGGGYSRQLNDLQRGVPKEVEVRANLANAASRSSTKNQLLKAAKSVGIEDLMVVVTADGAWVCLPFPSARSGAADISGTVPLVPGEDHPWRAGQKQNARAAAS